MKTSLEPLMSSERDDWRTPDDLWEWLNNRFQFDMDIDWKQPIIPGWPEGVDAFTHPWPKASIIYINPPYGNQIRKWVDRAIEQVMENNLTVVMLLPARTDTKWFHKLARHSRIELFKGRLKFKGADASAPFPSAIAIINKYIVPSIICVDWRSDEEG